MYLVQSAKRNDCILVDGDEVDIATGLEDIVIFFPEAYKYDDHYVVTVSFRCYLCHRDKVFTVRASKLETDRIFGCKYCDRALKRRLTPMRIYSNDN